MAQTVNRLHATASTRSPQIADLKAGDMVRVRLPHEILETLDADGTLDNLPFMPEMIPYCGKSFRVLNRVVQATIDGSSLTGYSESWVREFRNNDVVVLQDVRCSGGAHDDCHRGCAIFWKEAWLEKVENEDDSVVDRYPEDSTALQSILKTKTDPDRYVCQSSEFLKATLHLSRFQRLQKCFSAVRASNITVRGMTKHILVWIWWKTYTRLFGPHARGTEEKTPTERLDLRPGDMVEVKSLREITSTLSKTGFNRGLHFSADQRRFCGHRFTVRNRADNFITEGTGEMKHFRNTVTLNNVFCDSACFAFGGCYRVDLLYWREIWLKRVDAVTPVTLDSLERTSNLETKTRWSGIAIAEQDFPEQ